jgi:predicted MFS family arabinose efflux permease
MKQHTENEQTSTKPAWMAVFALSLGVAGLITSEFLPVSLLTPMAKDLHITEGVAGQAISITAIVAMISSLLITTITKGLDRRWVLLTFSLLQIISNILVAYAPNFLVLTFGRILLGIAIGGFWTMSASVAMRLVPKKMVPKALSIVFGAVSVATVVAAPLGSYMGAHLGWQNVFILAALLGVIALLWQSITLPSMAPEKPAKITELWYVLKRPKVGMGILANMLVFIGYATFFTYLRPFLETVTGVNVNALTSILLGFGIANLLGTTLSRHLLERNLSLTLILVTFFMAIVVAGLILFGQVPVTASILIALWGMAFGAVQVGWPTWLTRTLPNDAETGGGLQVAAVQLAITAGAGIGGVFFDLTGVTGVFICSSVITHIAAAVAMIAFRKDKGSRVDTKAVDTNETQRNNLVMRTN